MFLQIGKSHGRVYLAIVEGYRDPVTKKHRKKIVQSLGYLDDLKEHLDSTCETSK